MWQWLEQLRRRPAAQRRQLAFVGAVSVTAVIALVWVTSLPGRFDVLTETQPPAVDRDPALRELFAGVRSQFAAVRGALGNLTTPADEGVSTTATSTPSTIPQWVASSSSSTAPSTTTRPVGRAILIATSSTDTP